MNISHCGDILSVSEYRCLQPTADEALRGVVAVSGWTYHCRVCRKRLYAKQEHFDLGNGEISRVKKSLSAFIRRLKLATESDWVWGFHPQTFEKVKRSVR